MPVLILLSDACEKVEYCGQLVFIQAQLVRSPIVAGLQPSSGKHASAPGQEQPAPSCC